MKKLILTSLILISLTTYGCAQKNSISDCNRNVWGNVKNLPKEVCIPQGYVISYEHKPTDVNGDGLDDYIFDWNKYPLVDGDTLFLSIYTQLPDSSYTLFKTFNNLFPVNFGLARQIEDIKDDRLREIFRIQKNYPLRDLIFKQDTISIKFLDYTGGSHAGLILTYKYDKEKNDWFLTKQESWFELEDTTITDLGEPEPNQSIKDFNYLNWLE